MNLKLESFNHIPSFEETTTTGSHSVRNLQKPRKSNQNQLQVTNSLATFSETAKRGVFSGIGALTARS
jgi:hypothetical protein